MEETSARPPDPDDEADPQGPPDPVPNVLSGMSEAVDEELASTFAPDLGPETLSFGLDKPGAVVCQWCNTPLADPSVSTCPHCGAALQPAEPDVEVPGLTTMTPEARAAQARVERRLREASEGRSLSRSLLAGGAQPSAPVVADVLGSLEEAAEAGSFQPPGEAVQEVIRRMELEALMARQEILPPLSSEPMAEPAAVEESSAGEEAAAAAEEAAADEAAPEEPTAADEAAAEERDSA